MIRTDKLEKQGKRDLEVIAMSTEIKDMIFDN